MKKHRRKALTEPHTHQHHDNIETYLNVQSNKKRVYRAKNNHERGKTVARVCVPALLGILWE